MRRVRRLGIVLLTLSVVLSAVYATGAFSSLTAQRKANIQVVGDASSYLALEPAAGSNGGYATLKNGQLHVTLTGTADVTGQGVNRDAVTTVRDVFTVTNHGSQAVEVWLTDDAEKVTFRVDGHAIEQRAQAQLLQPGEMLSVGLVVDTRQVSGEIHLDSMTIHAASEGTSTAGSQASQSPPATVVRTERTFFESTFSVLNSLIPVDLSSASTAEDDTYHPPTVPVEETRISPSAKAQLKQSLPSAYDNRAEEIVYSILTAPNVAERYGEYRLMVGAPPYVDGWVALWVRGDTVVAIDRGGQDTSRLDPPLQDPIHVTTPDGRTVTVDPADPSLTVRQPTVKPSDEPNPLVIVAGVGVVVSPIDGMGPTDEIVAITAIVGMVGSFIYNLATDEETIHREQTKQQEQEDAENQQERQTEKGGDKSDGRRTPKTPRLRPPPPDLVPDGGQDERQVAIEHAAMDEMRRAGIPNGLIVDWSNKGYDVVAMNDALNAYLESDKTLLSMPNSSAQGEFGEIIAKEKVKNMYPRSQGYEYIQGVKLKRDSGNPDITEIDWVVVDTDTDNVVAIYQVKTDDTEEKAEEAENQLEKSKDAFEEDDVDDLAKASSPYQDDATDSDKDDLKGLTTDDFKDNLHDIDRYTIGPEKNDGSNKDLPEDYYDITFDLTQKELKALLKAIRKNKL